MLVQVPSGFFPLQWSRICVALDSDAGRLRLVADGQFLGETLYQREKDLERPTNLNLLLGLEPTINAEQTEKVTDFNVFSFTLTVAKMQRITEPGKEECGSPAGRTQSGALI